jgi:RNA polymerase sigma-70 factor, ECF subfamily
VTSRDTTTSPILATGATGDTLDAARADLDGQPRGGIQPEKRIDFEREALVHLDVVYRVARRLAGNDADADDLVQTTMLKAYEAWDRFERGSNAKSWLLTILRHAFIDEYRQRRPRGETAPLEKAAADPESAFYDALVDDQVTRAIWELPMVYREVFLLTDVGELRYHESAAILAVPVGTVKSRLYRARKLLQARLRKYIASIGWIPRDAARADRVARAHSPRDRGMSGTLRDRPQLRPTVHIDAVPALAQRRADEFMALLLTRTGRWTME